VWSEASSCSSFNAVPASRRFADGTVTVPVAVSRLGVTLSVAGTGAGSYTFVSGDVLCMSIAATGTAGANDIHILGDTASTSGAAGMSSLTGPFN
jgi:hypothetical protein